MTTNNDDTDDVLKNQQNFNVLEGYVKMDNPLYKIKLPEPKDFNISFRFADGEEVVFKEAKSLQDFIDKMNNYHELEKENQKLKELLNEIDAVYSSGINKSEDEYIIYKSTFKRLDELLNKWEQMKK